MPLSATRGRSSTKGRLVVPRFCRQLDDQDSPFPRSNHMSIEDNKTMAVRGEG